LHLLAMAVWFAGGLTLPSDIRKTLARGKPHTELLGARVNKVLSFATIGAVGTIATGLALFFSRGGFKANPPRFHAALGLSMVALALLFLGIRPAAAQLDRALASGEGKDLRALSSRLAMFTGIDHLLKLVMLILMVFPLESL
jgi:uncharacterized membrane protein